VQQCAGRGQRPDVEDGLKVRQALVLLVGGVVAPLALMSALSLVTLYRSQMDTHSQRVLERVRALRIALDVEIEATQRTLVAAAEQPRLRGAQLAVSPELAEGLDRLLGLNRLWSAVLVVEADGRESLRVPKAGAPPLSAGLDEATRRRVVETRAPQVSPLLGESAPGLVTYVVAPVVEDGTVRRIVAIAVPHTGWLQFLAGFPIDPAATLTLNDGNGRIVARTRDSARWAGRPSRADYWERTRVADEDYFANTGLGGERFITAFSHLRSGDWVLGTGMPRDDIEAAVRRQAALLALLFAAALAVAAAVAVWIGRGITRGLQHLVALTEPAGAPAVRGRGWQLDEVEEVRHRLDDSLRAELAARAAAEQASAARERFVSTLAHELRNPLAALHHALALLRRPGVAPQMRERAQGILERQVGHLDRLMNDLFEVARVGDDRLALLAQPVDLAELVRAATEVARSKSSYDKVILSLDLHSVPVEADDMRLQQVVTNLLDNAVKFSPKDSVVLVSVRREGADAVLEVTDQGQGIEPDVLPHVFDAYVRGPAAGAATVGLGLGLHVVRRIVAMHRGSVKAFSEGRGRGASFVVRLPVSEPRPAPGA
jgi:signal transduction histidine kinase